MMVARTNSGDIKITQHTSTARIPNKMKAKIGPTMHPMMDAMKYFMSSFPPFVRFLVGDLDYKSLFREDPNRSLQQREYQLTNRNGVARV